MNSLNQKEALEDALFGLRRGDFTRLDHLFDETPARPRILDWFDQGHFADHQGELKEAFK